MSWFLVRNNYFEEPKQKSYSPDFCHLMQKMLAYKPEDRLSLAQIRNHSWFKVKDIAYLNEIRI